MLPWMVVYTTRLVLAALAKQTGQCQGIGAPRLLWRQWGTTLRSHRTRWSAGRLGGCCLAGGIAIAAEFSVAAAAAVILLLWLHECGSYWLNTLQSRCIVCHYYANSVIAWVMSWSPVFRVLTTEASTNVQQTALWPVIVPSLLHACNEWYYL